MPLSQNVFVTILIIFISFVGLSGLIVICFDYYKFRLKNKNELERHRQLLLQEQQENLYL